MSSNKNSPSTGGQPASPSAAAAAAAAKAFALMKMRQREASTRAAEYYVGGVVGMIAIFAIFHWARYSYSLFASRKVKQSPLMKAQIRIVRMVRHVLTHRVPGFTSMGHAVLVVVFLAINVVLTVTNMDWSSLIPISKRLGWMALLNMAFIVFLALKNTPLAFLTAYSYERLNILHQFGGYATVTFGILHMLTMCLGFEKLNKPEMLLEEVQINGMIALIAMFVMLVFALLLRKIRYEVFYISHIVGFILVIVNVALHQPEVSNRVITITSIAAGLWGSDRVLRGLRILWYSYDNRATITPLPHGGTRIVLGRSPTRSVPGTHCFLWIPKIRAIETHPFTIVSKTPYNLELVISAYDGFTNDLHNYAVEHPGASLRASFDGPYGSLPDFAKVADRMILLAGGSGASFTFGVALDTIRKLRSTSQTTIDFIWSVREQEKISWYAKELSELQTSHRVNIIIHNTRPGSIEEVPSPSTPTDVEKALAFSETPAPTSTNVSRSEDPEKDSMEGRKIAHRQIEDAWSSTSSVNILPGRPDVDGIIKRIVAETPDDERVVIAACGPDALMFNVRRAAASVIGVKGPSVELHCEQFGW